MEIGRIARRQAGVVDRGQALEAGLTPAQVRWRVQSGDWQVVHRGVYVTNSGPVTWQPRAWAALRWAGPGAVLILEAAARLWRLQPDDPAVITVGVPLGRHPRTADGVRTVQRGRLDAVVVDGLPVTRPAQTVIDLADLPTTMEDDAIALAARACQAGRVTPHLLLAELSRRGRHRHTAALRLALGEITDGAESLPEVWFATRVQRPHGLPVFERQVAGSHGTRTDLKNQEYGVNVEVDGQIWHAGERFHTDRLRDRMAAAEGEVTVRLAYTDLHRLSCAVAADLGRVLQKRGWVGSPTACRLCRRSG